MKNCHFANRDSTRISRLDQGSDANPIQQKSFDKEYRKAEIQSSVSACFSNHPGFKSNFGENDRFHGSVQTKLGRQHTGHEKSF